MMKRIVDWALVKVVKDEDGKVEQTLLEHARELLAGGIVAVDKDVRFRKHEVIAEAGGPNCVEVQIAFPFGE